MVVILIKTCLIPLCIMHSLKYNHLYLEVKKHCLSLSVSYYHNILYNTH